MPTHRKLTWVLPWGLNLPRLSYSYGMDYQNCPVEKHVCNRVQFVTRADGAKVRQCKYLLDASAAVTGPVCIRPLNSRKNMQILNAGTSKIFFTRSQMSKKAGISLSLLFFKSLLHLEEGWHT